MTYLNWSKLETFQTMYNSLNYIISISTTTSQSFSPFYKTICLSIYKLFTTIFLIVSFITIGIKGWHAIKLPDLDEDMNTNTTMGGLQLSIKFEDPEDREAVVHTGRSLGWSPPPGIEYEDDNNPLFDSEDEDGESQAPKGLELSVKISRAWVPDSFIQELHMKQSNLKGIKGYVRYKLYDKSKSTNNCNCRLFIHF